MTLVTVAPGRGLGVRVMLLVLLGTTLFTLLAGLVAWRLGYQHAVEQNRHTLASLATAVEKTVATGVYARDNVLLGELLDGLARNPGVARVVVRTMQGEVLQRRGNGGSKAPLLRQPVLSPFGMHEPLAQLELLPDEPSIAAEARAEALRLTALMGGVAALLALTLYAVTASLVSNPIIRLARALQQLVPGTPLRLPVSAWNQHDEVGQLVHSTNALLDAHAQALMRERALRAEVEALEAQYRRVFDASSAGIFVLDHEGRLLHGNPNVFTVLGRSAQALRAQGRFVDAVFAEPAEALALIEASRQRGQVVFADLALAPGGAGARWVHCVMSAPAGDGQTVEGVLFDITKRKSSELAARYQAEHDSLTGLKNRAASHAMIDRLVQEAIDDEQPFALLLIDLDGFKQINDQHGHLVGDQVLTLCAQAMLGVVRRGSDLVGRLGGDEFVVALRGVGSDHPLLDAVASALLAAIGRPVMVEGVGEVWVGASIGITVGPRHGLTRSELVQRADRALYEVKASGKNAYVMAC